MNINDESSNQKSIWLKQLAADSDVLNLPKNKQDAVKMWIRHAASMLRVEELYEEIYGLSPTVIKEYRKELDMIDDIQDYVVYYLQEIADEFDINRIV